VNGNRLLHHHFHISNVENFSRIKSHVVREFVATSLRTLPNNALKMFKKIFEPLLMSLKSSLPVKAEVYAGLG